MSVTVFIGGSKFQGWTELTLSRSKSELTGSLSLTCFLDYIPAGPIFVKAAAGRPIMVYIGNHLSFTGTIDSRTDNGDKSSYSISVSARGKTKTLIDSSHQHKTGTMLKPTNQSIVKELIKPFDIKLDWKAENINLEKQCFRDGGHVHTELHRVASENAHFMYETRDGKLRVTDDTGRESGEALILGHNILSFSAEQSEDKSKAEITVKGKRTKKGLRGKASILPCIKKIKDGAVKSKAKITIHHFGDGDDKALERRGKFEANKRTSEAKNIKVDVFHVQTQSGSPWDVGTLHQVSIPPAGISGQFECTALEYHVSAQDTIKTSLTLSPPPTSVSGGSTGLTGLLGAAQSILSGVQQDNNGDWPAPWTGALLSVADLSIETSDDPRKLLSELGSDIIPLILPK